MSSPDFQSPRTKIGRHPLPWSIYRDGEKWVVRDRDGTAVGLFETSDHALWADIVATVNDLMPTSDGASSLTMMQTRALDFIERHRGRHGLMPSFQEISDGLGIHSKSGVSRLVKGLQERGRIASLTARPRSIAILRPLTDQERKACQTLPQP